MHLLLLQDYFDKVKSFLKRFLPRLLGERFALRIGMVSALYNHLLYYESMRDYSAK